METINDAIDKKLGKSLFHFKGLVDPENKHGFDTPLIETWNRFNPSPALSEHSPSARSTDEPSFANVPHPCFPRTPHANNVRSSNNVLSSIAASPSFNPKFPTSRKRSRCETSSNNDSPTSTNLSLPPSKHPPNCRRQS